MYQSIWICLKTVKPQNSPQRKSQFHKQIFMRLQRAPLLFPTKNSHAVHGRNPANRLRLAVLSHYLKRVLFASFRWLAARSWGGSIFFIASSLPGSAFNGTGGQGRRPQTIKGHLVATDEKQWQWQCVGLENWMEMIGIWFGMKKTFSKSAWCVFFQV